MIHYITTRLNLLDISESYVENQLAYIPALKSFPKTCP